MQGNKAWYQKYRPWLWAAAYLLIFAAGAMYLRVTISIPPEGDDKLTLNRWLYDFERMPFWQYLLQDLSERLDYFLLRVGRFFPFHYPSAFSLLFFGSLASYRLYIITVTALAAFLVSRVVVRLGGGNALALGSFALTLALAPIWNEGMFSYYAVPQKALSWAMLAWLCLFRQERAVHRRWGVAAAVFAFVACGTYEIGYMYAVLAAAVWCVRCRSVRRGLRQTAPVLGGMALALVFHLLNACGGGGGNALSLDLGKILSVTVRQMASNLPGLNLYMCNEDPGTITNGDRLWPLVLGVLAAALLLFAAPRRRLSGKALGGLAGLGLALWVCPALLLACSERYQNGAITWKSGYIPAAASVMGMALLAATGVLAVARLCCRLPRAASVAVRAVLAVVLAAGLCWNGAYVRACVRTHHAENLANYQFFVRSVQAGLADAVTEQDWIVCSVDVWAGNTDAETAFFRRNTGRPLHALLTGADTVPDDLAGDVYAYQVYRNYGGHDLAWCGKAQDDTAELLDGVQVYVQSALVPDNAVIKYTVRLSDGTEEARQICLLDCTQTPRDQNGDYIATVEDTSIVNAKIMIWDG